MSTEYTNAIVLALTDKGTDKGFDTPEEALQQMRDFGIVGNVVIQPEDKHIEWVFAELDGIIRAGMQMSKTFQTGESGGPHDIPRYGFEGTEFFEMNQPKPFGHYRCGFVYAFYNESTGLVEARDGYVDNQLVKILKKYGHMKATDINTKDGRKNPKNIFKLFGDTILKRLVDCGYSESQVRLDRNLTLKEFVTKYKLTVKDMI